jgi:hypothetical protein
LFATRREIEQLADLLAEVIGLQARLVEIVDRLAPPADTRRLASGRPGPPAEGFPAAGKPVRPGLRLVRPTSEGR